MSSVDEFDPMITNPHPWWVMYKACKVLERVQYYLYNETHVYPTRADLAFEIVRSAHSELSEAMTYVAVISEITAK